MAKSDGGILSDPLFFGIAAGVVSGLLAVGRKKPLPLRAVFITAGVVAVAEGLLVEEDQGFSTAIAVGAGLGHLVGQLPFAREKAPEEPALARFRVR